MMLVRSKEERLISRKNVLLLVITACKIKRSDLGNNAGKQYWAKPNSQLYFG